MHKEIQTTKFSYEIVDGKVTGVRIRQEEVAFNDDGSVFATKPLPEDVIAADDPRVKAILGELNAKMANQLDTTAAACKALEVEKQELATTVAEHEITIRAKDDALESLQEKYDELEASHQRIAEKLDAARAEVTELTAKLPVEEAVTDAPAAE